MKKLTLFATGWKTSDDLYDAFFKAVGAPAWHGRNFNALRDSITGGQINQIEPPYMIEVVGLDKISPKVRPLADDFCSLIKEFHAEGYGVDIVCT